MDQTPTAAKTTCVEWIQADDDHYIPRALLIDFEPRVVDATLNESACKEIRTLTAYAAS